MLLQILLSFQTNETTRTWDKVVGKGWISGQNREENFFRDTDSKITSYILFKSQNVSGVSYEYRFGIVV